MIMPLSSDQLEAFLTVSQTLNFTRAAEALHITQSALSQRIMKLEGELGLTLFIRERSNLRLTEAAYSLVRYCTQKNSLESEFLSSLQDKSHGGQIRIGGFSSVMSSIALASLKPLILSGARIHMIVDELTELPARLQSGEIDYLISDRRDTNESLERISLGTEKNVLVQKKKYKGPDIFLDHDEKDQTTFEYLKMTGQSRKNIQRQFLDDIFGLLAGVKLGLGRAILPKHLIQDMADLETVNPGDVLQSPVFLYYYTRPYYTRLHSQVVEALKRGFQAL